MLHSGHITAWYSRHDNDILVCTQTSWAQVGLHRKTILIHVHSAFCTVLRRFPLLHGCGAGIPGIRILIYSWYCGTGYRVAMATTREVEMLRRQLDELTAQMIEMRQQLSRTATNAAVLGLAKLREKWDSRCRNRAQRTRESESQSRTHLAKTLTTGDFTFNGYAGTLDPAYLALLKTARQSPTVVMATPPHEQQSAT